MHQYLLTIFSLIIITAILMRPKWYKQMVCSWGSKLLSRFTVKLTCGLLSASDELVDICSNTSFANIETTFIDTGSSDLMLTPSGNTCNMDLIVWTSSFFSLINFIISFICCDIIMLDVMKIIDENINDRWIINGTCSNLICSQTINITYIESLIQTIFLHSRHMNIEANSHKLQNKNQNSYIEYEDFVKFPWTQSTPNMATTPISPSSLASFDLLCSSVSIVIAVVLKIVT